MKLSTLINYLKWFFAFAVFGVAIYAIVQGWQGVKGIGKAFEPSKYAKDPAKGQTSFEKYFPNIAEAKDKVIKAVSNNVFNSWWQSITRK